MTFKRVEDWDDADRADYLAKDIELNGLEACTGVYDPWEPALYVRALRCFAAAFRAGRLSELEVDGLSERGA